MYMRMRFILLLILFIWPQAPFIRYCVQVSSIVLCRPLKARWNCCYWEMFIKSVTKKKKMVANIWSIVANLNNGLNFDSVAEWVKARLKKCSVFCCNACCIINCTIFCEWNPVGGGMCVWAQVQIRIGISFDW